MGTLNEKIRARADGWGFLVLLVTAFHKENSTRAIHRGIKCLAGAYLTLGWDI